MSSSPSVFVISDRNAAGGDESEGSAAEFSKRMNDHLQSGSGAMQALLAAFNLASLMMLFSAAMMEGVATIQNHPLATTAPLAGTIMAFLFFHLNMNGHGERQLMFDVNFSVLNGVNAMCHFWKVYFNGIAFLASTPSIFYALGVCELCSALLYAGDAVLCMPGGQKPKRSAE